MPGFGMLAFAARSPKGFAAQQVWAAAGAIGDPGPVHSRAGTGLAFAGARRTRRAWRRRGLDRAVGRDRALVCWRPRRGGARGGAGARGPPALDHFHARRARRFPALLSTRPRHRGPAALRPDRDGLDRRCVPAAGDFCAGRGGRAWRPRPRLRHSTSCRRWRVCARLPRITREAATVGLVAGMAGVVFTEPLGLLIARFFRLHYPGAAGRGPFIRPPGDGLQCRGLPLRVADQPARGGDGAAPVLSRFPAGAFRAAARLGLFAPARLGRHAAVVVLRRRPRSGLWQLGVRPLEQGHAGMVVGIPPLWAWQMLWWALGVVMIWFLADRLGLST